MAHVLRRRGLEVDPGAELLVGNGGTHALFCAARVVLDEGDEVLVASPYWPLAPGVFVSAGARPVEVPFTQRLYEDASLDPASLLAAGLTPRTKAVYVISPNNPDGKVLSSAQLERVAAFAAEHDLWIFSDEVYADTVFVETTPPSIATLPDARGRTITLHSLSKSHALAGLRIGYFSAPPDVVTAARRVSTHTAFNVSLAMQRAALAALQDEAFPVAAREAYRAARDGAVGALRGASAELLRFHVPEGATYLFVDFSPAIARAAAGADSDSRVHRTRDDLPKVGQSGAKSPLYAILERAVERGVLLAPGDAFGKDHGSSARLCFTAVPAARVITGLERLSDALAAYVAGKP
jgi:aspartate/methionine/tyrosine aminotransferase